MALYLTTNDPKALLAAFDRMVRGDEKNHEKKINTWVPVEDETRLLYTHTSEQLERKAYMRALVEADRLAFYIVRPQSSTVSPFVYGYYHGHLLEAFLTHLDKKFSQGSASAMPEGKDDLG